MSEFDPEYGGARRDRPPRASRPRARRSNRRLAALGFFLAAIVAVALVVIESLHLHPFGTTPAAKVAKPPTGPTKRHKPPSQHAVTVASLGTLSSPASRIAAVPYGTGGALFMGGYDAAGAAIDTVQNFQVSNATSSGTLPTPAASAVAATLASNVYLFGGGASTIYELTGTSFAIAGNLPTVTADAAVATLGNTAYVIGGYTGSAELNTIVAFTPGASTQIVATLPVTLRYATSTAIGGEVYIIGGATAGVPSATIYRFDPSTNSVSSFTTLAHARERETSAALGGRILVIGSGEVAFDESDSGHVLYAVIAVGRII